VKRVLALVGALVLIGVAAVVVVGFDRPWEKASGSGGGDDALTVERASLSPGRIVLTVRDPGGDAVRIAQVIVDDAFANFDLTSGVVKPRAATKVRIDYAWVAGEAYEIDLVTSTGAMVEYQLPNAQLQS
jgi:zinc transporter, ZIP family